MSAETIWQELVAAYQAPLQTDVTRKQYAKACASFLAPSVDRVPVLKSAMRGRDHIAALELLPRLSARELMALFEELIYLASWEHGSLEAARRAILSLPRDWVMTRVEAAAEPYLASGTDNEFRRFIELYKLISPDLARALALRASNNGDPHIREAGAEFLEEG